MFHSRFPGLALGLRRGGGGLLALADTIRPNAADTMAKLRALGVRETVMLTGDNRTTAEAVARAVGITRIEAEVLPEKKAAIVKRLQVDGRRVAIVEVVDSGRGMEPDILQRAFEPFFTTDSPKHTGLGLTEVRGFVHRQGGSVDIDSVPGRGTTVRLVFPAQAVPAGPA